MNLSELIGQRNYGYAGVYDDFLYIRRFEILFCFISKNASSFLKHSLSLSAKGKPQSKPKKNPHMTFNTGFETAQSLGHSRMSELLTSPNVLKCVVGREPLARIKSAYRSRVLTYNKETYDADQTRYLTRLRQEVLGAANGSHAWPQSIALANPPSFADFCKYLARTPFFKLDQHVVPQTYFACVDFVNYDLIGQVEELDVFLKDLRKLRPEVGEISSDMRINETRATALDLELPTEQESEILRMYSPDSDFFGYRRSGS